MKYVLYIIIFAFYQNIQSQSNINEEIFFDVISQISYSDKKAETGYLKKVDSGMLNYDLENFKRHSSLVYSMYQRNTRMTDSIELTLSEKKYIMSELKASENFEWNLSNESDLKIVENNSPLSILNFLIENKNRELKIVSKPIFIRNGSVACVYSAHLCCGHIYGHTSLSLYKLIDNKWTEWIAICQGDF